MAEQINENGRVKGRFRAKDIKDNRYIYCLQHSSANKIVFQRSDDQDVGIKCLRTNALFFSVCRKMTSKLREKSYTWRYSSVSINSTMKSLKTDRMISVGHKRH